MRSPFQSKLLPAHLRDVRGFTLVELVIVVTVIAILASIAYPMFLSQMRKGHRAAAQSYLMDLAQRQSQYMLDARAYAGDEVTLGYASGTPIEVSPYYTITVAAPVATPPTFTITATAIGTQVADGDISIDNLGNKLPTDKW